MAGADSSVSSLSRARERARVRARALRESSTDAERRLWSRLRDRRLDGYKFRRQHPVPPFIVDFVCVEARLIVELDGGQHFDEEGCAADERRTSFLAARALHVLRFSNRELLAEMDAVLSVIREWLLTHHPHPNPLPQAGEGEHEGSP
jgi:very-short-patch-repair endonuclease